MHTFGTGSSDLELVSPEFSPLIVIIGLVCEGCSPVIRRVPQKSYTQSSYTKKNMNVLLANGRFKTQEPVSMTIITYHQACLRMYHQFCLYMYKHNYTASTSLVPGIPTFRKDLGRSGKTWAYTRIDRPGYIQGCTF